MAEEEGDVVCVGLITRGQVVDWAQGGQEPTPAEWISEAAFRDFLNASAKAGVPVLATLDIYAQTRLGPAECKRILAQWGELQANVRGTPAEALAVAIGQLMQMCANGPDGMELLIEGP